MSSKSSLHRLSQLAVFGIIAVFVLGFVYSAVGAWTGPVLSAWFIGTQKVGIGFLALAVITFILNLLLHWRALLAGGIAYLGWTFLAALISLLPFPLYRLPTQRRQGFLATLSLPLWSIALHPLAQALLPASIFQTYFRTESAPVSTQGIAAILDSDAISFLIYWFAAAINWMWKREFQAPKIRVGASVFAVGCVLVLGWVLLLELIPQSAPHLLSTGHLYVWICLAAGCVLAAWSFLLPDAHQKTWAGKIETIALLRSPCTPEALHIVNEHGREFLTSPSGERFPIRDGVPLFYEAAKLTGSNQKYNRLYEIIGGFYDDVQRVACALRGVSCDEYSCDYMRFLETKSGDSVLETSLGTGLNYKYLSRSVKLFGLDLSGEMLTNCQANLRCWELQVHLFLGNAEDLPFADNSFDVVYHVGGINFFNDRAKAIREMIRVAKPGSRLQIADETEEPVKGTYERIPVTSGYFKKRQETVTAPIDLVPVEMQEVHLETLRDGQFYALTFRKPSCVPANLVNSPA